MNAPILHMPDDLYGLSSGISDHLNNRLKAEGHDIPPGEPLAFELALPDAPLHKSEYYGMQSTKVQIAVWGQHIIFPSPHYHSVEGRFCRLKVAPEEEAPCKIERVSDKSYTRTVTRTVWENVPTGYKWQPYSRKPVQRTFVDRYPHPASDLNIPREELPPESESIEYRWVTYRITFEDGFEFEFEARHEMPLTGEAWIADDGTIHVDSEFLGHHQSFAHESLLHTSISATGYPVGNPLEVLLRHQAHSTITDGIDRWWGIFLQSQKTSPDTKGLASLLNRKANLPCFDKLRTEYPLEWAFNEWLMSNRTYNKLRNNQFITAMWENQGFDADKIGAELRRVMQTIRTEVAIHRYYDKEPYAGARWLIAQEFGSAAEVIRVVEAKTDFRKRKTAAGKADGLGIEAHLYPKLRAAVEAGDVPASVFANPDGTPLNREYALWERALNQKGWAPVVYEIAQDAGRRSTYEKDVTPYLAFLFKLGPYLDRHTPGRKKWRCMPKYVQSQWELEMGKDGEGPDDNGTTKRRSAFTPVADNETRIVEVPYVAVCVTGRVSQWCYSKEYYVFEDMMVDPVSKGVVVNEVEEKLNGRDDYGLMFYTLNGTATAQGYPTFLIIFERREQGGSACTFVHFHRVHPKRRINGQWTPACELIDRVYQYMVGDVPATDVRAQQGDMVYIVHPNDPIAAGAKVEEPQTAKTLDFESHNHVALGGGEVKLYVSTAKTPKNRLGFIQVGAGGMAVRHPEHDDIEYLAAGWYEVRRCRSWEANPKAIWSLTID